MSWSTRHKIIYFFVFLVVFGILAGVPAFFIFYDTPTCTDNRRNGDETGIDCGGSCQRICLPELRPPVVYWQQAFNIQGSTHTAVAYVQNPNPNGESFDAGYTFRILDTAGSVIAERKGKAFIPAGRNFAVFESGIAIPPEQEYGRTLFEFDQDITWLTARRNMPVLGVVNQTVSSTESAQSVDVDIQNPSFNAVRNIEVTAIAYDGEGNAFTASKTFIDSIPAQASRHVVFTWPRPFEKASARIEIIPLIR